MVPTVHVVRSSARFQEHTLPTCIYSISSLSPDHSWACLSGMWRRLRLLGNASVEKQENLPAPPPLIETFFWDSSQRIKMSISYLFETLGLSWLSSSNERNQDIQLASSTIELQFPGLYLELEGICFTGSFLFELWYTHIFIVWAALCPRYLSTPDFYRHNS